MSQWPVRLILLAATTGILLPYCFPRYDFGLLAWVALVPLHIALDGLSRRTHAFWLGWLAGIISSTGIMSWVVTAMNTYGKGPVVLSYGIMLLLTAHLAVNHVMGRHRDVYLWEGPGGLQLRDHAAAHRLSRPVCRALQRRRRLVPHAGAALRIVRRALPVGDSGAAADLFAERTPLVAARLLTIPATRSDSDRGSPGRVRRVLSHRADERGPGGAISLALAAVPRLPTGQTSVGTRDDGHDARGALVGIQHVVDRERRYRAAEGRP